MSGQPPWTDSLELCPREKAITTDLLKLHLPSTVHLPAIVRGLRSNMPALRTLVHWHDQQTTTRSHEGAYGFSAEEGRKDSFWRSLRGGASEAETQDHLLRLVLSTRRTPSPCRRSDGDKTTQAGVEPQAGRAWDLSSVASHSHHISRTNLLALPPCGLVNRSSHVYTCSIFALLTSPFTPNSHLVPYINSCLTCVDCNCPTDDDAERRNVLPNIVFSVINEASSSVSLSLNRSLEYLNIFIKFVYEKSSEAFNVQIDKLAPGDTKIFGRALHYSSILLSVFCFLSPMQI